MELIIARSQGRNGLVTSRPLSIFPHAKMKGGCLVTSKGTSMPAIVLSASA